MKTIKIAAVAAAIVLALTGCGASAAITTPAVRTVDLPDGGAVYCVVVSDPNGLGIDCIEEAK